VREINEPIPASGPQSAGRIIEALVGETHREIGSIFQRCIAYFIGLRIVLDGIILHTRTETIQILQIRFHISLPESLGP